MSYQLDALIRDLARLRTMLPPETEVRIAQDGHWYDLYDIMFKEINPVASEHTCESNCICDETLISGCPCCECPGCLDDELPEMTEIYICLGDQHPYDLPHLISEESLREVLA